MEKISCYYYLFAFTFFVAYNYSPVHCLSTDDDETALFSLKNHITSDPFQILQTNWTNNETSSSVCTWIGVTCGRRHNRVTSLDISNMNLSGTLPPQLGNLSFLSYLYLAHNFFSGVLPENLSLLRRLKLVSLAFNNFTGVVPPWFGFLPHLQSLILRNNSFTGFVPSSFSNLRSLRVLSIGYNDISGPIPAAIFSLSNLEIIDLSSNGLNGNLPADICRNLPVIREIYLSYNHINGEIPSNLSECSQLKDLYLYSNNFSGQIPTNIGKLISLQNLYLGSNKLDGVLPEEIGNLQNLLNLNVDNNQITGPLPHNIFNISSLQVLQLENNNLTGRIPPEIGNLTMLKFLSLSNNSLTGVLPREIGKLHELVYLRLASNSFYGTIPPQLFNISTLEALYLTDNALSGNLPSNLGDELPSLENLYLNSNHLSGAIPASISNCSNLRVLVLGFNYFTGFVPHFLGNRRLQCIQLFNNNLRTEPNSSELSFITSLSSRFLDRLDVFNNPDLDGIIPASIGNLSSLLYFGAENCKIKGSIPEEIGKLSKLVRLGLTNNELTGKLPFGIRRLHNLQGLYLANNHLRGSIPETLCDLHSMVELYLGQNNFSGPIPQCFGDITSLSHIFLESNMLSSSIPSNLWLNQNLLLLDLSSNFLSGFLPPEIRNLQAAIYVNLSMNQLSKHIPTEIGQLLNLASLSLARNRLEGSIPETVGNMTSLETLDFSYNNLSGTIPKSLEEVKSLKHFNVSFNELSGEIPTGGPFSNFTVDSYKANAGLCGFPVSQDSSCSTVRNHRSRMKSVVYYLLIPLGVVASIALIALTIVFVRRSRRRKTEEVVMSRPDHIMAATRISYYELLQATEQFSESNLLGSGSFGSVFKGILIDGKLLAIKVFHLQSEGGTFRSFDRECEVLRSVRHRNIVKVISSCSNQNFKALILEYMPNGSLDNLLYSHDRILDIMQRLNIMIDVASALEYLHHGYLAPIVHCDLKPSNVLLDEEMVAHVSDFGIAKLLGHEESFMLTSTLATLGYIAPEYGFEGLVSTKSDVYSYGIMLMEIFTRRRPSDDMFSGELSLKSWIERSVPMSSNLVIDANLLINPEDKNFDSNLRCLSSVLELALKCAAETPGDRINMTETLVELKKLKCQLLK